MSRIDHSKILIQPGAGKSTCQIFILEAQLAGEETFQDQDNNIVRIFGLIEVETTPNRKINSLINSLIQEIELLKSKIIENNAETFFEKLIQKINYKYLDLISNKSLFGEDESSPPKINALLSLESENDIYIAQRGRALPFLIYQAKPKYYKIINITETAAGRESRNNINLFTNIISGKMNIGDYLFFTTESLLDYFSLEKICKTVSGTEPKEVSDTLRELLSETANQQTSFAALVVKSQAEIKKQLTVQETATEKGESGNSQNSMSHLLKTAENTEKMLTPSLRLNIGSGISSFFGKIKNSRDKKKQIKDKSRLEYYSSQFSPPSRINQLLKPLAWLFLAIFRSIYLIIKTIILSPIYLFNFFSKRNVSEAISTQDEKLPTIKTEEATNQHKVKSESVPRPSRTLLISAAVFVILFIAGTAYLYLKYNKEAAAESLRKKIEIVKDKKNSIEASLIYNDEDGARKFVSEALALLETFPQKTNEEKAAYDNLSLEIKTLQEKLRHIINIKNPDLTIDISNYSPSAAVNEFIVSGKNLYAFDLLASAIYKINLETKEATNQNAPGMSLRFGFMTSDNSALLYQPENEFYEFDLQSDVLKQIEVIMNDAEKNVTDLAIYNQRLYILDEADNQIFKHNFTLAGFGQGLPWLKEGADIKSAVSLAIDGSIYVAKSDGTIIKFDNGNKSDFYANIDSPLSSPTKIWTSPESPFIYILEPAGKRLVVVDKEGKLKNQYYSEQFDDLRDFVVTEKEKKIYLLAGNKIFTVDAAHL